MWRRCRGVCRRANLRAWSAPPHPNSLAPREEKERANDVRKSEKQAKQASRAGCARMPRPLNNDFGVDSARVLFTEPNSLGRSQSDLTPLMSFAGNMA